MLILCMNVLHISSKTVAICPSIHPNKWSGHQYQYHIDIKLKQLNLYLTKECKTKFYFWTPKCIISCVRQKNFGAAPQPSWLGVAFKRTLELLVTPMCMSLYCARKLEVPDTWGEPHRHLEIMKVPGRKVQFGTDLQSFW